MTATLSADERIRARAYSLWEAAGCRHGEHERHWHQAAMDVAAEAMAAVSAATEPRAAKKASAKVEAKAAKATKDAPKASKKKAA